MYHTVNVWMCLEHLVEILLLPNIHMVEKGSFATDELDAIEDFFRRVVEIVRDDDLVVSFEQG